MKLPTEVQEIRKALWKKYPLDLNASAGENKEEAFRQWCIKFAQTVSARIPGQGWGVKRADPGRPISKDTIARNDTAAKKLWIWDLFGGVGTDHTVYNSDPDSADATGQYFVPDLAPKDWLETSSPPTPPSSTGCSCKEELAALKAQLNTLQGVVLEVLALVKAERAIHLAFRWTGSADGTLKPPNT